MQHAKHNKTEKKASTVRRLLWANAIAALALLTVTALTLWALGLLDSIVAFFF